ncbi:hypothetical protein [Yersinia mollaretii]|uniref:hypothetical protein n=1 Tax=Yersinia mollaretii TaxID=33060 RepID=UPI0005E11038|nr:hypothetical protein [Yersinia mollaretii]MDA5527590.1 hypothetical protein [Yersinia mollaretii]MDR7875127.1 hypothetical protein [Yersinia mollaretii]PHZ32549.1 hypothetical protein CS537_05995 [Yersinia mollaretii]WQC74794.1 hypothetical protein U1Z61_20765 [Yersinia mollaretii]CND98722.1 Uncharacterised protein [Yersinia mollaretii]
MFRVTFTNALLMASAFSIALPGMAADSAPLTLKVNYQPAACGVNLSSQHTDFGDISPQSLTNNATGTPLNTPNPVEINVTCSGEVALAVMFIDHRKSSTVEGLDYNGPQGKLGNLSKQHVFGLGYDSQGSTIGGWVPYLSQVRINGEPTPFALVNQDGLPDAISSQSSEKIMPDHGFTPVNHLAQVQKFTQLHANMHTVTTLSPLSKLSLRDEVRIDGNITVQITYL